MLNEAKPQFQKAVDHLSTELMSVRTGRANPAMIEDLSIEAYGTMQGLKSLASISVPDAKTLQVEPWDASVVKDIEKALMEADLGMTPTVDGKIIRLHIPMMTDETRQRMVKKVREKMENARIAVRQVRDDVKKKIEKIEGIGEDDKRGQLADLDKYVKELNVQIEDVGSAKEEEVATV
ncbi:ribosome recycling factor [Candidatus Uhrbacteria bacterium]|jgi:ribosome recycling factor|nr:ribosome recycling factor [Candidatus Uhrbacteria bacterium]